MTPLQHNILVDNNGVARISEYGLQIALRRSPYSRPILVNARWMAPEVLSEVNRRVSPLGGGVAADVYSFAIVAFEASLPSHRSKPVCSLLVPGLGGHHPVPTDIY